MTRKTPLKDSIQYEIFNRIEFDPVVERLEHRSFRVFLPRKWINKMDFVNNDYFFVIDNHGRTFPRNQNTDYARSYIDITLKEGSAEYMSMMQL